MTMVIAQHSGLLPFGWTGVWLFYVISGFVISRNFINDQVAVRPSAYKQYLSFIVRRIFRIIPPYGAYIAICFMVIHFLKMPQQSGELPYLFGFLYNWRMMFSAVPQFPAFGHLWTISVEEQFYIFFPIIILLLRRDLAIFALAIIVVVAPVLRFLMAEQMAALSWDPEHIAFGVYASSVGQFDAFACGALLAHFEGSLRRCPKIAARLAWLAFIFAAVYATIYVGLNIQDGARGLDAFRNVISGVLFGEKREVFVYMVMDICALAVLAGAIVGWKCVRLIERPLIVSIGQVSYGGYLVHALVLLIISLAIGNPVGQEPILVRISFFILVWSVTVAIAWISYNFFERRFISYGHTLSNWILLKSKKSRTAVLG